MMWCFAAYVLEPNIVPDSSMYILEDYFIMPCGFNVKKADCRPAHEGKFAKVFCMFSIS